MNEYGKTKRTTVKQRQAIAALLIEPSVAQAARAAGVGERTLHRWLKDDPDFITELRAAESQLVNEAARRLLAMQGKALDAVAAVLDSASATNSELLRAADLVLAHSARLRELVDLDQRLSAVEAVYRHEDTY